MSRGHEKSRDLEVATTGVCRESEFPPTEELNASAANPSFRLQIIPKTCYDAVKLNQFVRSVADA